MAKPQDISGFMGRQSKLSLLHLVFIFLGALVLLFILSPLLGMFLATSPESVFNTIAEPEVYNSIWLTLWTSMAGTLLFAVAAIPLAYLLARRNFPLKRLVLASSTFLL